MESTTSIHNDTDSHVVSYVGVNAVAAIVGSVFGTLAVGGAGFVAWVIRLGTSGAIRSLPTLVVPVAIGKAVSEATQHLVNQGGALLAAADIIVFMKDEF